MCVTSDTLRLWAGHNNQYSRYICRCFICTSWGSVRIGRDFPLLNLCWELLASHGKNMWRATRQIVTWRHKPKRSRTLIPGAANVPLILLKLKTDLLRRIVRRPFVSAPKCRALRNIPRRMSCDGTAVVPEAALYNYWKSLPEIQRVTTGVFHVCISVLLCRNLWLILGAHRVPRRCTQTVPQAHASRQGAFGSYAISRTVHSRFVRHTFLINFTSWRFGISTKC